MQGLESPGLESGINSFKEAGQNFNKNIEQYIAAAGAHQKVLVTEQHTI